MITFATQPTTLANGCQLYIYSAVIESKLPYDVELITRPDGATLTRQSNGVQVVQWKPSSAGTVTFSLKAVCGSEVKYQTWEVTVNDKCEECPEDCWVTCEQLENSIKDAIDDIKIPDVSGFITQVDLDASFVQWCAKLIAQTAEVQAIVDSHTHPSSGLNKAEVQQCIDDSLPTAEEDFCVDCPDILTDNNSTSGTITASNVPNNHTVIFDLGQGDTPTSETPTNGIATKNYSYGSNVTEEEINIYLIDENGKVVSYSECRYRNKP